MTGQRQPWDEASSGTGWLAPGSESWCHTTSRAAPIRATSSEYACALVDTWKRTVSPARQLSWSV